MTTKRNLFTAAVLALGSITVALVAAACAAGDDGGSGGSASSGVNVGGQDVGGQGGGGSDAGGSGGACSDNSDCGDGVCNDGVCCDSQEAVCGEGCCVGAEVCLFDICVVPGDDCFSAADCPEDHYCEPALGEAGGQGGAGGNCTQPLASGKCVPLPPKCTGSPNDPPDCLEVCEYVPTPGQLNATAKWQWGYDPVPTEFSDAADVWSTPAVGRVVDANCDGKVDLADPPNVVVVSANANNTTCLVNGVCRKGILRVLDGRNGQELWSLAAAEPNSTGFSGVSVALGDVDNDQQMDVMALTGEGKLAIIGGDGQLKQLSSDRVDSFNINHFGWGGGIALGDMNNDGFAEIAYGRTVFTMANGSLELLFKGTLGYGSDRSAMSHFIDLNNDGQLELLAGRTAYEFDGTPLWHNASVPDGFTGVGDFNADMDPEVVLVANGNLYILDGATGALEIGPHNIPGNGHGGPPTVADFNGDGQPEVGVAMQNFYSMMKPNFGNSMVFDLWSTSTHDESSSRTGSSVFDFDGDGKAEVVYMDECFLWVYDGTTGNVRYTTNTQSSTATESSIVADVDGDGHAEIVVVHNAAAQDFWTCAEHTTGTDGYPVWAPPAAGAFRGITVLGDTANSWVSTRTLWNQHAYSVTNICDPRDGACSGLAYYGQIPTNQLKTGASHG